MNKLYLGDNLDILKSIDTDSIDLVYADPPYNSKRVYYTDNNQKAFDDFWKSPATSGASDLLFSSEKGMAVSRYLTNVDSVAKNGSTKSRNYWEHLRSYLAMLAPRLVEIERIVKAEGSTYIHCDYRVAHYVKGIMDIVYGFEKFRNDIVWCYAPHGRQPSVGFVHKHDNILLYADHKDAVFNRSYTEISRQTEITFTQEDERGEKYRERGGKKQYLENYPGKPIPSWWSDIAAFHSAANSEERTGYPTQKPEQLIERIVNASSNVGDKVLDPFCGSGTTLEVAIKAERAWVGIDVNPIAINIVETRLGKYFLLPEDDYEVNYTRDRLKTAIDIKLEQDEEENKKDKKKQEKIKNRFKKDKKPEAQSSLF